MLWLLLAHTQCIRTFSSMFLRSFMLHHKHIWPRTLQSTRVCMAEHTYMHSCCSNPITQSESLHKLLSVAWRSKNCFSVSLPFDRSLLSPSTSVHSPTLPLCLPIHLSSFIFTFLKKILLPSAFHSFTLSLSFHSFIHFQSQHFSYSSFMFWFLQKKKKTHPPSSLCLLFWFSEPHSFIVSLFEP